MKLAPPGPPSVAGTKKEKALRTLIAAGSGVETGSSEGC
jgi:hypothetical protein